MLNENQKNDRYVRLEMNKGNYFRRNEGGKLLGALAILFTDGGPGVSWFKEELLDPDSRGIYGSLTHVSIRGEKVILEPKFIEDEDEFDELTVEIDRNILLRLANEWQALVMKDAPEIFIVRKDGELFVTDTLPEGMEE